MSGEGFHEPRELLSSDTIEMHRAIVSLMEELEAVDWYQQRADACGDAALKEILLHNMDEELEHAAMVLEWMRRKSERVDHHLREMLFREGEIGHHEDAAEDEDRAAPRLAIGSTRRF